MKNATYRAKKLSRASASISLGIFVFALLFATNATAQTPATRSVTPRVATRSAGIATKSATATAAATQSANPDEITNTASTSGITISPPKVVVTMDPGEVKQEKIKIRNLSAEVQTYYPRVYDYESRDEIGTPFTVEGNTDYGLANWIVIAKDPIVLQPGDERFVQYTISIPEEPRPGGHYGAILFSTTKPEQTGSGVGVISQVGTIFLVNVTGDVQEMGTLEEFKADKSTYENPPVKFVTRFKNTGNTHVQPLGDIRIKNTFGSEVAKLTVNDQGGFTLPASIRKFENEWKDSGLHIGRYTAELSLGYGSTEKKSLTAAVTFWILPWKIIAPVVVILALIIVIALMLLRRGRKGKAPASLSNQEQYQNKSATDSTPTPAESDKKEPDQKS